MSILKKFAVLFLLLEVSFEASTQKITFNHLSVENGLSNNSVLAISQDKEGFLWFGTRKGLNRYDGTKFKIYTHNAKDSNSIADNNIVSLFCDSKNNLWIGSSSGLNIYNRANDSFEKIHLNNNKFLVIYCIDETRDGSIWVGTSNGLFIRSNSTNKQFTRFQSNEQNGIAGNTIRSVCEDHLGQIWLGTNNGLSRLQKKGNQYIFQSFRNNPANVRSLSANYITAITEDRSHRLWIGTQNQGLNLFLPATGEFVRYSKAGNGNSGLINNNIRIILTSSSGMIWIGTQEGLSVMNPDTKTIESYQNEAGGQKSLSQNSVYSLYEDTNGSFWVGTYFGGVNSTLSASGVFNTIQHQEKSSSLSNNVVSSIVEDNQENLWIGTEGGGLNFLNRKTGLFTIYKNILSNSSSLASNLVKVVMVDKEQNIWCGTHGGGLNVLDRKKNQFIRYLYKENDAATLWSEITSLAEDDNERLWVVSNSGLKLFKKSGTGISALPLNSIPGALSNIPPSTTLYKDLQNNIWIGASPGLFKVSGNNFEEISNELSVNSITQDKNGHIWAALKNEGLAMYNTQTKQLTKYTQKDGLPNQNIIGILEDSAGNLWLSTDNGLIKFNPDKKTLQTFTTSDGLAGNEFNYNSFLRNQQGEFFFGGYNGISHFFPEKIESNLHIAPMAFTGLRVFNTPVGIHGEDELLSANINQTKEIAFRHDQNVFTLEFALLNFIKSEKNKYAYKLEGFDEDWNEVNNTSATYTNLPSGTYTFWVKGANNDGVWSNPISIKIKVLPAVWFTWWAYCLYALIIIALLFLLVRFFFLRELLKKEDELHKVKLNFFTNVSHEIRTHLTLIMAPVDKLLHQHEKEVFIQQQLSQVKSNANRLLKLVNELMDFRKAETSHLKLQISRQNLIPVLQDIYSSFQEMSLTKQINISFIHNVEEMYLYFDKEQLEKVFYNLLVNAFKFTPEGGRIYLIAEQKDNKVIVSVTDNGRGIAPEYLKNLFTNFFQVADHGLQNTGYGIGLALSKNIVELHKGSITVESEPAEKEKEGKTVFTVTLLQGNQHFDASDLLLPKQPLEKKSASVQQEKNISRLNEQTENNKTFTVLIADDNDELRALLKDNLADTYHIVESANGKQAWETATEQIPDCIISDVMMPEMDGITLCAKLKSDERTSHIPVILLTAKTAQNDQVAGLEKGADIYITKPFSAKILELSIRNLLSAREKMRDTLRSKLQLKETTQNKADEPRSSTLPYTADTHHFINQVDEEFLLRVIQIVNDHLEDPDFGVDKLARKVAMSPPILYKKIKAVTNMSVNEFVKSIRLKKAAQLLQEGNMTVYEVAFAIGYNDRKYFSQEFKKYFGKTPSEYAN